MAGYDARSIADPVHKSIGLSDVELGVIASPAYQRLRNVKQLGLAYLVFPGADYSRFSHSIGVCHVTGQILEALRRNCPQLGLTDKEIQLYRLAGLLHDIGHYPFSHTTEHAVDNYYKDTFLDNGSGDEPVESLNHEQVGKKIIQTDEGIRRIISDAGIRPDDVYSIFLREQPPRLANLISSDLDADRIDYLLRTAHHTGLPYGSVDLPYLLSQMRVDDKNRICLTRKAVRTAEHFLLSRYFDYSQVAFHKTVAALELVLSDVISTLLRNRVIDYSARTVSQQISDGSWAEMDDASVLVHIAAMAKDTKDSINAAKARSIVTRNPPKMVWESSHFNERNDRQNKKHFQTTKKHLQDKIPEWSKQFGVHQHLWWIWDRQGIALTKVGSHVPVGSIERDDEKDRDRWEQSIRILKHDRTTSEEIMNIPSSLMSVLADQALFSLRLYVLLEPHELDKREKISAAVLKEFGD